MLAFKQHKIALARPHAQAAAALPAAEQRPLAAARLAGGVGAGIGCPHPQAPEPGGGERLPQVWETLGQLGRKGIQGGRRKGAGKCFLWFQALAQAQSPGKGPT